MTDNKRQHWSFYRWPPVIGEPRSEGSMVDAVVTKFACPLCGGRDHTTNTCPSAPRNKHFIEEREKFYREKGGDTFVDRWDRIEDRLDQFDDWRNALVSGELKTESIVHLHNKITLIKRALLSLMGLLVVGFLIGTLILAEVNTRIQQEIRSNQQQAREIQCEIDRLRRETRGQD